MKLVHEENGHRKLNSNLCHFRTLRMEYSNVLYTVGVKYLVVELNHLGLNPGFATY